MMTSTLRTLYAGLIWLHPPGFRRAFSAEMLWIFDEALPAIGAGALFTDGVVSLLRQWLIGCGTWKIALAMVGGLLEILVAVMLVTASR